MRLRPWLVTKNRGEPIGEPERQIGLFHDPALWQDFHQAEIFPAGMFTVVVWRKRECARKTFDL
jgi:hypothetical protein